MKRFLRHDIDRSTIEATKVHNSYYRHYMDSSYCNDKVSLKEIIIANVTVKERTIQYSTFNLGSYSVVSGDVIGQFETC